MGTVYLFVFRCACILAFNVDIEPNAEKLAKELGVKIFKSEIIYHLFEEFTKYIQEIKPPGKDDAVFPCILEILQSHKVPRKSNPIIVGVKVKCGELRIGTPLCAMNKGCSGKKVALGVVKSMQWNGKFAEKTKSGNEICISSVGDPNISFGRQFDHESRLLSVVCIF